MGLVKFFRQCFPPKKKTGDSDEQVIHLPARRPPEPSLMSPRRAASKRSPAFPSPPNSTPPKNAALEPPPLPPVSKLAALFLNQINSSVEFSARIISSGNFTANLLSRSSEDYKIIEKYIKNSQVHPDLFEMEVLDILQISRRADINLVVKSQCDNRIMLWHGTVAENILKILDEGFRTPESKGQLFGTGIYFADRASKSGLYCAPNDAIPKPVSSVCIVNSKLYKGFITVCNHFQIGTRRLHVPM